MPTYSAAVSLQPAVVIANQPSTVTVAVTSSGAAVTVAGIQLMVTPAASSWEGGQFNLGPNVGNLSLANNGTTYYSAQVVFKRPTAQNIVGGAQSSQNLSALVTLSDGTVFASNGLGISVNTTDNNPVGAGAVTGQLRMDNGLDSALLALVAGI